MASNNTTVNKSSAPQPPFITQLIKDCNIPNNIRLRLPSPTESENWRTSGLGNENLIMLGKKHIEIIRLPIHPLILQFLAALRLHPMQLTPNSFKFLTASIILNEVEGKDISVEDLLYVFKVKRTPTKSGLPKSPMGTFYLSASKNYFMFSASTTVDKDWDRNILVVSGAWFPKDFNHSIFPLVDRFSTGMND